MLARLAKGPVAGTCNGVWREPMAGGRKTAGAELQICMMEDALPSGLSVGRPSRWRGSAARSASVSADTVSVASWAGDGKATPALRLSRR